MESPALNYAPRDPTGRKHRRRRLLRWLTLVLAIGLATTLGMQHAAIRRSLENRWRLYQIYHYNPPAAEVVYDEDPRRVPSLLASGKFIAIPIDGGQVAAGRRPPAYAIPVDPYPLTNPPAALLYLHTRNLPNEPAKADTRLLQLFLGRLNEAVHNGRPFASFIRTFPADPKRGDARGFTAFSRADLDLPEDTPSDFRLFAGQTDPTNPSDFTVAFEANGQPGTFHFSYHTDNFNNNRDSGTDFLSLRITFKNKTSPPQPLDWDSHCLMIPTDDN